MHFSNRQIATHLSASNLSSYHLQVRKAKEAKAEASLVSIRGTATSEKSTVRLNMQTIANANQSYKLQTGIYTANVADLAIRGSATDIVGPGTRTYSIELNPTGGCDWNGDGNANIVPIPAPSFWVTSSEATDGCFIPGFSSR